MTFYKWNELQGKQKGCDLSAEVQVVVDKTDFESGHITFRIKKNKEKKKIMVWMLENSPCCGTRRNQDRVFVKNQTRLLYSSSHLEESKNKIFRNAQSVTWL